MFKPQFLLPKNKNLHIVPLMPHESLILLVQNGDLHFPAFGINLLKEFDVLVDFLFKYFAFFNLFYAVIKRNVPIKNDLPFFSFRVISTMKAQSQWEFLLPFIQQNGVLKELYSIGVFAEFFKTSILGVGVGVDVNFLVFIVL